MTKKEKAAFAADKLAELYPTIRIAFDYEEPYAW